MISDDIYIDSIPVLSKTFSYLIIPCDFKNFINYLPKLNWFS